MTNALYDLLKSKDAELETLNTTVKNLREEIRRERQATLAAKANADAEADRRRLVSLKLDKAVSENKDAEQRAARVVQGQLDALRQQLQDAQAKRIGADNLRQKQAQAHETTKVGHEKALNDLKTTITKLTRDLQVRTSERDTARTGTTAADARTQKVRDEQTEYINGLILSRTALSKEHQATLATLDGVRRHVPTLNEKISSLQNELRAAQLVAANAQNHRVSGDAEKLSRVQKDLERKTADAREAWTALQRANVLAVEQDAKRLNEIKLLREEIVKANARASEALGRLTQLEQSRALA